MMVQESLHGKVQLLWSLSTWLTWSKVKWTFVNAWGDDVAIHGTRWFEIVSYVRGKNLWHMIVFLTKFTVMTVMGKLRDGESCNEGKRDPGRHLKRGPGRCLKRGGLAQKWRSVLEDRVRRTWYLGMQLRKKCCRIVEVTAKVEVTANGRFPPWEVDWRPRLQLRWRHVLGACQCAFVVIIKWLCISVGQEMGGRAMFGLAEVVVIVNAIIIANVVVIVGYHR